MDWKRDSDSGSRVLTCRRAAAASPWSWSQRDSGKRNGARRRPCFPEDTRHGPRFEERRFELNTILNRTYPPPGFFYDRIWLEEAEEEDKRDRVAVEAGRRAEGRALRLRPAHPSSRTFPQRFVSMHVGAANISRSTPVCSNAPATTRQFLQLPCYAIRSLPPNDRRVGRGVRDRLHTWADRHGTRGVDGILPDPAAGLRPNREVTMDQPSTCKTCYGATISLSSLTPTS